MVASFAGRGFITFDGAGRLQGLRIE